MSEALCGGADQQCPVCWNLLCEPVAWPECAHHFCLMCALQTRRRPKPVCPLCRAPARQVRQAAELEVSTSKASSIRKAVGYSSYQAQRRETWAQVVELDAAGGLGGPLALVAGRSEVWQRLRLGSQQEVMMEPKYAELLEWSRKSKGGCFAVVLQPADFEVGAKGRVCHIVDLDLNQAPEDRRVVVEAGAACRVIELSSEMQRAEAQSTFFVGKLEELDEEELLVRINDLGPLAAAADIVHILGVLGRNLQAVRQRWMMTALVSLLDEDTSTIESPQDRQGLESMLGVMMSYRQIIHQMDALLSQASATADRLIPPAAAVERDEEVQDEDPSFSRISSSDIGEESSHRERPEDPQEADAAAAAQNAQELRRVRVTTRREVAVSQAEALRRRGHVLPVAGANVAAVAPTLSLVRRNARTSGTESRDQEIHRMH